jgi:hypothetical protein
MRSSSIAGIRFEPARRNAATLLLMEAPVL